MGACIEVLEVPISLDDKSALVKVSKEEGLHVAWELRDTQGNKKILVFEHIPTNHPSTFVAVFDPDDYIQAILRVPWILKAIIEPKGYNLEDLHEEELYNLLRSILYLDD